MTVPTTTNRQSYAGDDSTKVFAIPFRFDANADIVAILRDAVGGETTWSLNTEYTLVGAGNPSGGTLTVASATPAPATGETLLIKRVVPITQAVDYQPNDDFPEEFHEGALDKLTFVAQQLKEILDRAIALPETSSLTGLTIPDPEAAKFLRWNTGGTALENADITGSGSIGIPVSIAQGGTSAANTSDARKNLLPLTTAEDLLVGLAVGDAKRLAVGSEGDVLQVVSSAVSWAALPLPTGMTVPYIGTTAPSGWILLNGDTIAKTSGATHTGATFQTLYELFWNSMADAEAPVAGGRGISATADWDANKALTIPDARGRAVIGSGTGAGLTARTHGAKVGQEDAIIPSHSHGVGTLAGDAHSHTGAVGAIGTGDFIAGVPADPDAVTSVGTGGTGGAGVNISGATATTGEAVTDKNMPPSLALNFIVKV